MNKYQEELDMLTRTAGFTSNVLQRLVERAKPKKPKVEFDEAKKLVMNTKNNNFTKIKSYEHFYKKTILSMLAKCL